MLTERMVVSTVRPCGCSPNVRSRIVWAGGPRAVLRGRRTTSTTTVRPTATVTAIRTARRARSRASSEPSNAPKLTSFPISALRAGPLGPRSARSDPSRSAVGSRSRHLPVAAGELEEHGLEVDVVGGELGQVQTGPHEQLVQVRTGVVREVDPESVAVV